MENESELMSNQARTDTREEIAGGQCWNRGSTMHYVKEKAEIIGFYHPNIFIWDVFAQRKQSS